jgi:hypothetical protein
MISVASLKTLIVTAGTIKIGEQVVAGSLYLEVIGYINGQYIGWEKPGSPLYLLKIANSES